MKSKLRHLPFLSFVLAHRKVTVIALVILLIVGFFLRPKPPKPPATIVVSPKTITQTVVASGTVQALTSADLNFLAGGKLTYLGVKKGDEVKQYQVIASLDQRTMQKNLENALIDYAKQRNTYDQTVSDNNGHSPKDALSDAMKRVLENNQNDLTKAINSVELQQLAREQATLVSPIAGIVTRADVKSAGVNVGATTTFSIADPDELVFNVDVDESDIGKINLSQRMSISLDAFPDQQVTVPIDSIDFASHTTSTGGTAYTVQALLPLGSVEYRIGMNGDAEIIIAEKRNALVVPLSSLVDDQFVYVKKQQKFEKRKVKLGIQSDLDVQVISGVEKGEEVATQPSEVEKQKNLLVSSK